MVGDLILDDLETRVGRLLEVGVGYLTLERASPSLSSRISTAPMITKIGVVNWIAVTWVRLAREIA